ncbi:SdrD B-like domain-containing protein, partial [Corynebacterium diphtheriae]
PESPVEPEVKGSVSVGDFVWNDTNADGRQDDNEPGLAGVELQLVGPDGKPVTDVNGKPVGNVTTGEDGKYSFKDLPVLTGSD